MLSRSSKPYPFFIHLSTNRYFPRFWKPYYIISLSPFMKKGFTFPKGETFKNPTLSGFIET
jgi:hypothetical protein